ncbi:DEAD/DEAH box helicase, putative [Talaromyces stipitatus ATCC 10500]|uniref:ATP-dependent RNA helicase n=1 Tax=Talaromyces stipitatus (strain ATCC 10500 / CBS 375.48 / QM 6759 / NRRL 1006) TaxID=441959 RepID=B8M3J9_TALSN|nr:DEAD/DEAH box helicase, putative [Talaromyces stipitatus ATCC 10500]EED22371.1 DEAD/DEAH box helicase, putative [Talaromyces stipitatus ATCC 10500]
MAGDKEKKRHGGDKEKTSRKKDRYEESLATSPVVDSLQPQKKRKRESKLEQSNRNGVEEEWYGDKEFEDVQSESQASAKGGVSRDRKGQKSRDDGSKGSIDTEPPRSSSRSDEKAPDLRFGDRTLKKTKKRKNEDQSEANGAQDPPSKVKKRKHEQVSTPRDEDERHDLKHAKLLKKFEKSIKAKRPVTENVQETSAFDTGTAIVAQGLEPLPQPEPVAETSEKPTYSTMPDWITNPVTKSPYDREDGQPVKFENISLDRTVVSKLEKHGYSEATPVQATVIPLLLDEQHRHRGDLCVSASTGSGKTLSYVLPINQSLQRESVARLRALVIVPTRELVKQAREAFEACGSNLRIGTAIGSVVLKDEQQKIIRWDSVYSPEKYNADQQRTMSESDWAEFDLLKYRDEVVRAGDLAPQYIQVARPNIDVLISTPGRLVDHIRQTEGFSLRHLQWLVVDEADRLLNESFQEWVSVLMGALDKEKTANIGDSVLARIGRPIQSPYPRKVILSATLTNDITKLNSLRLENPKLVAIGSRNMDSNEERVKHEAEQFVLPPSLMEHFVPVGDGFEKPIYLMKLLLMINKSKWNSLATPAYASVVGRKSNEAAEDSSSDSDSTSSSDDTSSSDEASDSESDSDSESSDASPDESESSSDSDSETSSIASETSPVASASNTGVTSVLIFTKSTESAARLSHLLSLMNPSLESQIGTIVKSNNSSSSRKTLKDYRAGRISIIVATDRASRGIDLVGLGGVINYDMPTSLTTYVHRVGRTARAGKSGQAWTLVEHREGLWFQKVIVKSENVVRSGNGVKAVRQEKNSKAMVAEYTAALEGLEKAVKG